MGIEKKEHIRSIARMEPIAERWQEVHGRPCTEDDVEAMFQDFVPLQRVCIIEHANIIPGTLEAVAEFRARRLKIGSTTGYSTRVMQILLPEARRRGYDPDACVCPDEVPAGRPFPWMAYANAMRLSTYPMEAMVKVGDTLPDIAEGLNAGMWTIGVVKSGNEIGLSEHEILATDPADLEPRLTAACYRMGQAGAHYVVKTIANVPQVLDEVERRIRNGDRP
jgi:phosphonoacetaldehyde hydrolase